MTQAIVETQTQEAVEIISLGESPTPQEIAIALHEAEQKLKKSIPKFELKYVTTISGDDIKLGVHYTCK
jgi:hypothetical protein